MIKAWQNGVLRALAILGLAAGLMPVAVASAETRAAPAVQPGAATVPFTVKVQEIDDLKAVFATVQTKDRIEARVRIPGTVAELKTSEGKYVQAGEVLALVADQKLALRMSALEAQIVGARSRRDSAKNDLDRAAELLQRGVTPRSRYDQLKAAFDTVVNEIKALEAERGVVARQLEEGKVLAPAEGRVLRVPVTVGSVVMPGESIATIAANAYLLRIEVPERHARFIKTGDTVKIGARGLGPDRKPIGEGRIVLVHPELQNGRVIADAESKALGNFFVGERALVWIAAGKRDTIVIPQALTFKRYGIDYVRLARKGADPIDVVVQLGEPHPLADGEEGIEVLAGLKAGDQVVKP